MGVVPITAPQCQFDSQENDGGPTPINSEVFALAKRWLTLRMDAQDSGTVPRTRCYWRQWGLP